MLAILNVLFAILGLGALSSGGGGTSDPDPAEPVTEPSPPIEDEDVPPAQEDEDAPALAPGALTPGASNPDDPAPADPFAAPRPPAPAAEDPPAKAAEEPPAAAAKDPPARVVEDPPAAPAEDPPAVVAKDPPAPAAEDPPAAAAEDPPAKAEDTGSDAPDLPNSAYALGWSGLTAQEQYMLELVNRARMDPEAEEDRTGERVDSGVSTAPKQALAVDPILSAAADNHSQDMLDRNFFSHTNPDGDSPTARARDEGWEGGGVWENISARWTSASSVSNKQNWVDLSHEGLWESNGHQFGMLQASHTVVGIGIDWGAWSYPGRTFPTAMVVTEKFANDGQTYLTGVVIDDADNDDFYDIGEGQGGVQITVWNDDDVYATSTWDSGGYSIALDAGTYNVRFEGGDLDTAYETSVTIGDQNEKLDVNEDDLGVAVLSMAGEDPAMEEDDPIDALFLSADASLEAIEQGVQEADRSVEEETDDLLVMV